ncbi:hypothetical protein LBMAG53_26770 [Planctomycetota bacterium]|nr:hypothetical protein LBMAG53_26770 [Planctomycetota bacterium]
MSSPSGKTLKGIGAPIRLPLSVAGQVAWTSIRVRMVRSLVTVSSVVLAVAFLLTVLGEAAVNRAVWVSHSALAQPERQAAKLRAVLEHPRSDEELLDLVANQAGALAAWRAALPPITQQLQQPVTQQPGTPQANVQSPAAEPDFPALSTEAGSAVRLIAWIDDLKPSQRYLLVRNRLVAEFVLNLDAPGAAAHCRDTSAGFKGVRLPLDRDGLDRLAAAGPRLRTALGALAEAEQRRLAQVAAAGGPAAVAAKLTGPADPAAMTAAGAPLDQILPGLTAAGQVALAGQIRLDRMVVAAASALAKANEIDPSLLRPDDVTDWPALHRLLAEASAKPEPTAVQRLAKLPAVSAVLGAEPDGERLRTALNAVLTMRRFYKADAWKDVPLAAETKQLTQQNLERLSERRLIRLNRLLTEAVTAGLVRYRPAPPVVTIDRLADGDVLLAPAAADLKAAIETALSGVGGNLAELSAELSRRKAAGVLTTTFSGLGPTGYDPDANRERTFWLVVLSLLVCTVGIVNAMTMAVTERFREIATMKCLGALDSFIVKAFLIESAAIGLVGAGVGAVGGVLVVLAQAQWRFGGAFWQVFPASELALVAAGSIFCGLFLAVVGALFPAVQAARMSPIEAMRVDL